MQVLAARVNTDEKPVRISFGESMHIATVTSSQVKMMVLVARESFIQLSKIQIKGRFAPN